MPELTVPSGARVVINEAGFQQAWDLKSVIVSEIAKSNITLNVSPGVLVKEIDLGQIMSSFLKVDTSPAVQDALFVCLGRCTYNDIKITKDTFEDSKARQDFYEIAIACAHANVSPFFKSLISRFSPQLQTLMKLAQALKENVQK